MRNAPATLTQKQQKFVAEYMVDGNGTRAAMAAGYGRAGAAVAAHRVLKNAKARAVIEARQGVDAKRLEISRQDVIRGLLEAIEQGRAQANPMAQIAGWREIGRMVGLYEPQRHAVEVSAVADAEMGRLERLSDAELVRLAAAAG